MRRNWLVLSLVCVAVVMMAVLPGCRSKKPSDEVSMLISNAKTYSWKLADLAWQKVKDPMNANLSAMENLDEIETDPTAKTPDFSKVSGGGIYIVDGQAEGNMCIGSIEWSGAGDTVLDGFAFPADAEVGAYEMIQNGQINQVFSPDSGYAWTAYCPDWADAGATLAQIDKYYDGRIKLYGSADGYKGENADPESTFVEKGAYVYTMFAKEPEEGQSLTIDKELDLSSGSVTIEFKAEGESAYPAIIKIMIRDAEGDWYLGGSPEEEGLPPEEEPEPVEGEEVAEIDETFAWTGWGALVGWNQNSAIRKSDATGFAWTGYSPTGGEVNPINSDENWGSRIKFEKGTGNIPGNYVFTIFDITGGNEANRWVNMSAGTLVVSLDKEGEDGAFPLGIKILARDGEGNWFLSDAIEVNIWDNSIAFADLEWKEVDSAVAGWMNQLKAGGSSAYGMKTGEDAATPDLTKVTGGGIYIDSITDETKAAINLTALKWTAGADE